LPPLVLDGEIAVPDERGVTHIDLLTQAMRQHRPDRLVYFAFDLLHLDRHDRRPCAIEDRKALLRDIFGAGGGKRIVVVDRVILLSPEASLRLARRQGARWAQDGYSCWFCVGILRQPAGASGGHGRGEPCRLSCGTAPRASAGPC
jgi:hypothetical protein